MPSASTSNKLISSIHSPSTNYRICSPSAHSIFHHLQFCDKAYLLVYTVLITIALLPHIHAGNLHLASAWCSPRGVPLISRIPEVVLGRETVVRPWLAALAILEPAIGAANGDVQEEVEFLIKGRGVVAARGLGPDVSQLGSVAVVGWEAGALPERLVKVRVEDLEKVGVDVGEEVLLGPFQTVFVRGGSVGRVEGGPLDVGAPPGIVCWVRAPVQGGRHDVVSSLLVGVVISSGLHDVDFSGQGPGTVGVIDRQHPNGGPQPISSGKRGSHLDTSKLDLCSFLCVDTS
jgi:hypothetical protein